MASVPTEPPTLSTRDASPTVASGGVTSPPGGWGSVSFLPSAPPYFVLGEIGRSDTAAVLLAVKREATSSSKPHRTNPRGKVFSSSSSSCAFPTRPLVGKAQRRSGGEAGSSNDDNEEEEGPLSTTTIGGSCTSRTTTSDARGADHHALPTVQTKAVALKVMAKHAASRRAGRIEREYSVYRDILNRRQPPHPFLVRCLGGFQTTNCVALEFELCSRGTLRSFLGLHEGRRVVCEETRRRIMSHVLAALRYLHWCGVVYRDLKPDNVFIREDGTLALGDFDLSAFVDHTTGTALRHHQSSTVAAAARQQQTAASSGGGRSSLHSGSPQQSPGPATRTHARLTSSTSAGSGGASRPLAAALPRRRLAAGAAATSAGGSPARTVLKPLDSEAPPSMPEGAFGTEPATARPAEGVSVAGSSRRKGSFVGTPFYMAPEVVTGAVPQTTAVDMWCFGVMLYELTFGVTPFQSTSEEDSVHRVANHTKIPMPAYPTLSKELRALLLQLLQSEPGARPTAAQTMEHRWFRGVDWATLPNSDPPLAPYVSGSTAPAAAPPSLSNDSGASARSSFATAVQAAFPTAAFSAASGGASGVRTPPPGASMSGSPATSPSKVPPPGSGAVARAALPPSTHHREEDQEELVPATFAMEPLPDVRVDVDEASLMPAAAACTTTTSTTSASVYSDPGGSMTAALAVNGIARKLSPGRRKPSGYEACASTTSPATLHTAPFLPSTAAAAAGASPAAPAGGFPQLPRLEDLVAPGTVPVALEDYDAAQAPQVSGVLSAEIGGQSFGAGRRTHQRGISDLSSTASSGGGVGLLAAADERRFSAGSEASTVSILTATSSIPQQVGAPFAFFSPFGSGAVSDPCCGNTSSRGRGGGAPRGEGQPGTTTTTTTKAGFVPSASSPAAVAQQPSQLSGQDLLDALQSIPSSGVSAPSSSRR